VRNDPTETPRIFPQTRTATSAAMSDQFSAATFGIQQHPDRDKEDRCKHVAERPYQLLDQTTGARLIHQ
jgi:hypothetical protein